MFFNNISNKFNKESEKKVPLLSANDDELRIITMCEQFYLRQARSRLRWEFLKVKSVGNAETPIPADGLRFGDLPYFKICSFLALVN